MNLFGNHLLDVITYLSHGVSKLAEKFNCRGLPALKLTTMTWSTGLAKTIRLKEMAPTL